MAASTSYATHANSPRGFVRGLLLLGLFAGRPAAADEAVAPPPTVTVASASRWGKHAELTSGLYPLWEETGRVPTSHSVYLGTDEIGGMLTERFELSLNPDDYIHRAPNLAAKLALLQRPGLRIAWRTNVLLLFRDAHTRFFVGSYSSRFSNKTAEILLWQNSLALSYALGERLEMHVAATLLPVVSIEKNARDMHAWGGLSTMLEIRFVPGASLLLHGGEVGLWEHDFAFFGASLRLSYAWLTGEVGYLYRVYRDGVQTAPMLRLGIAL